MSKKREISFDEAIAQSVREPNLIENPITSRIFFGVFGGVSIFAIIAILRVADIGLLNKSFYSTQT